MRFLKKRAENHVFFQCSNCGKIDELAVVEQSDGKRAMVLVEKDWGEVLGESIQGLASQLQSSSEELSRWREENPVLVAKLQQGLAGWKELQHLIYLFPNPTPGEIVTFPWQFTVIEADRELSASLALAAVGYYKDAFKSLRSFFELTLFGLFLFRKSDEEYFSEWFVGKKAIPPVTGESGLITHLLKNPFLQKLAGEYDWKEASTAQYRLLSNFIHGRGKAVSNLWLWQKAHSSFNESAWEQWLDAAVHTLELTLVPMIGHFPRALTPVSYFEKCGFDGPAGLYLDHEQVETVRAAVPTAAIRAALERVVKEDEQLHVEIEDVARWPDLTTEQIDKSLEWFRASLADPEMKERVREVLEDGQFRHAPTVQWSILLNLQRKFVRDASLMLVAKKLGLVPGIDLTAKEDVTVDGREDSSRA